MGYSSAFNTVIPHRLNEKLSTLCLHPTICDWLLDFLTGRPQSVGIGNRTSASIIKNVGTPQGCFLSPILYTVLTYDCVASHKDNTILNFADAAAVIGCITGGNKAYRREVASQVSWCEDSNLILNTDKMKEVVVDMRRSRGDLIGHCTSGSWGVHISDDLTWSLNTTQLVKRSSSSCMF